MKSFNHSFGGLSFLLKCPSRLGSMCAFWLMLVFVVLVSISARAAYPDPPYLLVSMTNQAWKYNQSGSNLGSAWRTVSYDDSIWPSGRGVFAVNSTVPIVFNQTNTILSLTNASGGRITTYYFRTHFALTNDVTSIRLYLTNLIDDGAVFYLNGAEAHRFNMPASPSPITYITTASSALEASYNVVNFGPELLVPGDNVLAVEVHNASSSSSDVVFGCAASIVFPAPTPLAITNQPLSQIIPDGGTITLSVGATGLPIAYQWYKNDLPIPDAVRSVYTITNASLQDQGAFYVVVSNSLGVVTSHLANVSVLADITAPSLSAADGTTNYSTIVVTFSEAVDPFAATNLSSYVLTNTGGGILPILAASRVSTNTIILTAGPRSSASNYVLIAAGIQDVSHQSNSIPPNSMVPVSTYLDLVGFFSRYRFFNPYPPYDDPNIGTNWPQAEFVVPETWGDNLNEPGAFWVGAVNLTVPRGKELSQSPALVNYFRTQFPFNGSPLGAELSLRAVVDSGAVFYLNGSELYRTNMPQGAVAFNTPALTEVTNAALSDFMSFPSQFLKAASNTLAVELHSAVANENTLAFAAEMRAKVNSLARGPIIITWQPVTQVGYESGSVTFRYMASGPSSIQWYRNGQPIPGATDADLTIANLSLDLNHSAISVMASNEAGIVWSDTAELLVLPDIVPPRLLSAIALDTNVIRLSFSKPLDEACVTNILNYALTNRSGLNPAVLAASLDNPSNILLQVTQPLSDQTAILVSNVCDASSNRNPAPPGAGATLGWQFSVPIDAAWDYNASGQDLGTTWRDPNYDSSNWSNGLALFYVGAANMPAPKNTLLPTPSGAANTTYYFRKKFQSGLSSTNAAVIFDHIVDDGAVFYLNGKEFYRMNMPSGLPTYSTLASSSVGTPAYSGQFTLKLTNLIAGENVIAAEVHQGSTFSSDAAFALRCAISIPSTVFAPKTNQPPVLHIARDPAGLYWLGDTNILEESSTLAPGAQWRAVPNRANPYFIPLTNAARFYRLRQ